MGLNEIESFSEAAFIGNTLGGLAAAPDDLTDHAYDVLTDALHEARTHAESVLELAPDANNEHRTY